MRVGPQMSSRLKEFSVSYPWSPGRRAPRTSLKDSHLKEAPATEASEVISANCSCVSHLVTLYNHDLHLGQHYILARVGCMGAWPNALLLPS